MVIIISAMAKVTQKQPFSICQSPPLHKNSPIRLGSGTFAEELCHLNTENTELASFANFSLCPLWLCG